ncbi:MAG TPA: hypothetical protein VFE37_26790 [Chloroflexota bacterium]|nr:hypothetical protein [Chloroflexota bacterium]
MPEKPELPLVTPREAASDLVGRAPGGPAYWAAVLVLAALAAAGVAALVVLAAGGPEPRAKWGYTAATLAFLLSTAGAAPTLAFTSRLGRGYWGIPLRRAADLFALSGLVVAPLYVLVLAQLPDWRGRTSIWNDWPGAPGPWAAAAVVGLALAGLALVYVSGLPDLAAARDVRRARPGGLALGWTGSLRRWDVLGLAVKALGAVYALLFVYVNLLASSDLAMSLVPYWHSAVIPPYHAISGYQGGIAMTIVALAVARRWGGLERYVTRDQFHAAAKLLLALALLFFYFTWCELLTYWYGRTPAEEWLLGLLMFRSYAGAFVLAFALCCVVPFLLLLWNPIRGSMAGATVAAALVLVGLFFDRIRMYVAAWQVAGPVGQEPSALPPPHWPGILDALVMVGLPAAVLLLYLLALRFVPAVSLWEYRQDRLLRVEREFVRTKVAVIAKPS